MPGKSRLYSARISELTYSSCSCSSSGFSTRISNVGWSDYPPYHHFGIGRVRQINHSVPSLDFFDCLRYPVSCSNHQISHLQDQLLHWYWPNFRGWNFIRYYPSRYQRSISDVCKRNVPLSCRWNSTSLPRRLWR